MTPRPRRTARKPRTWTRWCRFSASDPDAISILSPRVTVAGVKRMHALIGDDGEYFRVTITEVLPRRSGGTPR